MIMSAGIAQSSMPTLGPAGRMCAIEASQAAKTAAQDTTDWAAVRRQFPIFTEHPELIFFDNASTTQKPSPVIETISHFYGSECSNHGRASYRWSTKAARAIEDARQTVARFLNGDANDIVFTSGATESLNLVASCWGLANLADGDEVMLCYGDHKSAVLPWLNLQRILSQFGKTIKLVPIKIDYMGDYHFDSIRQGVGDRTRLVAISHVHHLHGLDMEVGAVREMVGNEAVITLDASQSIGHTRVDVQELDVDFISFSGHKMFAANGTGVLWSRKSRHSEMSPIRLGGGTRADIVNGKLALNDDVLSLLEGGTSNIPGIMSFADAVGFIQNIGIDAIERRISELTFYLYERMKEVQGIEFAPGSAFCNCTVAYGILSFQLRDIPSTDLSFMLDSENIFVRSGDHCIADKHGEADYLRVSLHVYNTKDEIDRFVEVLKSVSA